MNPVRFNPVQFYSKLNGSLNIVASDQIVADAANLPVLRARTNASNSASSAASTIDSVHPRTYLSGYSHHLTRPQR